MKGQSVELVPFVDHDDCALMAKWCTSASDRYHTGTSRFFTPEEVRDMTGGSGPHHGNLLIRALDGPGLGAVEWRQKAYSGSYTVGLIVGDDALWGRGYGVEAILLVLELLFHSYNARRVEFMAGSFNRRMMEIFAKDLFHVEGVLRDYFFLDGEYHDAVMCSILRHEYYDTDRRTWPAPRNAVPESEKQAARRLLQKYLTDHPLQRPDLGIAADVQ